MTASSIPSTTLPAGLTAEQEQHLNRALEAFNVATAAKYRAGVAEHGGNLWEHPPLWLLDEAMKECQDQWIYLFTLRERLVASIPK